MKHKKNPAKDLQRNSSLYFAIGLTIVLFISWQAIEWKTYEKLGFGYEALDVDEVDDEEVPITEQFKTPERVLIAFDGSAVTRKGIEMVAVSPLFKGLPVHVVMAGQTGRDQRKPLAWACQTLEQAGFDVAADSLPGNPEDIIDQIINQKGIDLLVMGAYSHSPLRNLFKRSKTTELLRRASVPTLLLR